MKKFLKFALNIFICFCLIACSNKNVSDTDINNPDNNDNIKSDILVHLEINPSFDIHVDNGGVIVGVDCLNNDSEDAYEGLDILYSEYTSGVKQLLKSVHDKGYMKNNSVIKFHIKVSESVAYDISNATSQLIDDFTSNVSDVSFEINMEALQNKSDTQQNNNENERPSHVVNDDGSEFFYTFYQNGNIETEEARFTDNSLKVTAITKFDENGTPLSEVTDQEDGFHRERTYTNGILSKEYMHIPQDGGHNVTRTFYENGQLAEEIDYHIHKSQEFIYRYDKSGNQTEYIGFDNNDKPVHIKY